MPLDNDGHLFWDCTFHPFVKLRNKPEFLPLMNRDLTHWPRCLLWNGWVSWAVFSIFWFSFGPLRLVILLVITLKRLWVPTLFLPIPLWHPFRDQDDAQDMVDDVPVTPNI